MLPTLRRNKLLFRKNIDGFTYLSTLLVLTGVMHLSALSVQKGVALHQSEKEQQLLLVGYEYEKAIIEYTKTANSNTSATTTQGPLQLQDLLKDPRYPGIKRYLRKLYSDPMAGTPEWGLVKATNGNIIGVYSTDNRQPTKKTGFDAVHNSFDNAKSYSQWVFGLPQARLTNTSIN